VAKMAVFKKSIIIVKSNYNWHQNETKMKPKWNRNETKMEPK